MLKAAALAVAVSLALLGATLAQTPQHTAVSATPTVSITHLRQEIDDLKYEFAALEFSLRELHAVLHEQEEFARELGIPVTTAVIINECSKLYNLPKAMILAVMSGESSFRARAENTSNKDGTWDRGLMQINEGTAPWLWTKIMPDIPYDPERVYHPPINIHMGCWYLRYLLDQNQQDYHRAFTAYNRGPTGMRDLVKATGSAQSKYSTRVMAFYLMYSEKGE